MQTVAAEPMIQVRVVRLHVAAVAVRQPMAPSYMLSVMAVPMIFIIQMGVMVHIVLCRTNTQLIVAAAKALPVMNSMVMVAESGRVTSAASLRASMPQDMLRFMENQLAVLIICSLVHIMMANRALRCVLLQICQS